jgi:hypothetical protein
VVGDPIFDQFAASQVEIIPSDVETEQLLSSAAATLLDRIGSAILSAEFLADKSRRDRLAAKRLIWRARQARK